MHKPSKATYPGMRSDAEDIESRGMKDYERQTARVDGKIRAHDTSGVETELYDFSDLDDGYGNKVAHGDISMQRMIEDHGRPGSHGYPKPYDTAPCLGKK